jgi:WD40 repeat protein
MIMNDQNNTPLAYLFCDTYQNSYIPSRLFLSLKETTYIFPIQSDHLDDFHKWLDFIQSQGRFIHNEIFPQLAENTTISQISLDGLQNMFLDLKWLELCIRYLGIDATRLILHTFPSEIHSLLADILLLGRHVLTREPSELHNQIQGRSPHIVPLLVSYPLAPFRLISQSLSPAGGPLLQAFQGHTSTINHCAISQNEKYLVSASDDYTLRLWEIDTGHCLHILQGHEGKVRGCVFHEQSNRVLSVSYDKTLRIWDITTGKEKVCFSLPKLLATIDIAHDGHTAICGTLHGDLYVIHLDSGQVLHTLSGHQQAITACAISNDQQSALSSSTDGTLRLWNLTTGSLIRIFEGHTNHVTHCCWFQNDTKILSSSRDGTLRVWETRTSRQMLVIHDPSGDVSGCGVFSDRDVALSCSHDHSLKLWDLHTGALLRMICQPEAQSQSIVCFPSTFRAVSCSYSLQDLFYVWTFSRSNVSDERVPIPVDSTTILKNSPLLLLSGRDGNAYLYNFIAHQTEHTYKSHQKAVTQSLVWNESTLITASQDRTLKVWNRHDETVIATLQGHKLQITACVFVPQTDLLLSASWDSHVRLWDLRTFQTIRIYEGHHDFVTCCRIAPDGRTMVTASRDRLLLSWNIFTGEQLYRYEGHTLGVVWCDINPQGTMVVSSSWDKTLRLWDMQTHQLYGVLVGHTDAILRCLWVDDRYILSTSFDGTLRLWDTQAMAEKGRWTHEYPLYSLAYDTTSQMIYVSDFKFGTLHLIHLNMSDRENE